MFKLLCQILIGLVILAVHIIIWASVFHREEGEVACNKEIGIKNAIYENSVLILSYMVIINMGRLLIGGI